MFMNKTIKTFFIFVFTGVLAYACREPFDPSITAKKLDVLVIDGYINAGLGKTEIILSKVSALDQSQIVNYEENAEVYIESDASESFLLVESDQGIYVSEDLNLSVDKKYRLYVKLKNNKEYRTGLLHVKVTPPIDSVSWEWEPDLLYIYVNTHDDQKTSRYYRWSYREDWQIRSQEISTLEYREDTILSRPVSEQLQMLNCWKKATSSGLIFSSSQNLTSDVMKFPITKLPHGAEENRVKYSIIVNQHTLTQEEYNYLSLMEKNTTQTGSFFDPMPSQLFGNIINVQDQTELVVGYVGVYTTERDTLFIESDELPPVPVQESCDTVHFVNTSANLNIFLGGDFPSYIPYETYYGVIAGIPTPMIVGMVPYCLDCRLRGTNIKPEYWP